MSDEPALDVGDQVFWKTVEDSGLTDLRMGRVISLGRCKAYVLSLMGTREAHFFVVIHRLCRTREAAQAAVFSPGSCSRCGGPENSDGCVENCWEDS